MIRFRLPCLLLSALLILLTVPCPASAQGGGTVKVGYYENEIFQEGARQGAYKTGYAYEFYRKLSEYTGWKYEYVYGSFSELYELFLAGKIDLLAGLAWKQEREGSMLYPEFPMGNESLSLLKHDDADDISVYYPSLNGKTIGVLDSAIIEILQNFLVSHNIQATIVSFAAYDELFAAFDERQLDLLAAEGDGASKRNHAEVLCQFGTTDYYLCVSAGREDLLEQLNEAQTMLFSDDPNYINSLRAKYYPTSISSRSFSFAERKWLDDHDILRIGFLDNYLPFCGTTPDGSATGLVKDVVDEILENLNIKDLTVEFFRYDSSDRMTRALGDKEIDVCFPVGGGLFFSEENGIYQSKTVVSTSVEVIYNSASTHRLKDLNTSHFAVNRNNSMQYNYLQSEYPGAQLTFYPTIEKCLDAVLEGKVDCTTMNTFRNNLLKNRKYRNLISRQLPAPDDRSFGIRIGDEGLLRLFNRGISVLGEEYIRNLSFRYRDSLYSYSMQDFLSDHMGATAAFLGSIMLLVIFFFLRDSIRSKEALQEAEKANRSKTIFLNNMSHDIRTPMNAIVGFTALASDNLDNKELVKDYLKRISVSSQHLLSLLNDVLDMSRIESGRASISEGDANLPQIIDDIQTIIDADIKAKKQNFSAKTNIVHPDVIADKLRLNQILLNLLSNSIKYTPPQGTVELELEELGNRDDEVQDGQQVNYRFVIRDTGIGMSEEFQKVLFQAFTRENSTTVNGIQGTGLGMAITKRIVQMMNGSISVKSKEGEGSEFSVVIPFKINKNPCVNVDFGEGQKDFSGNRVLLTEDTPTNQMIAQAILERVGLEVEIANNGEEAVSMMESNPPDYYRIILMDIQMPIMDGYEATKRIRAMKDPVKAGIPIIALTANAFSEDRAHALEVGMNEFLAKPYDVPKVMEMLDRYL
ncbi:MAG: transporter substrate-binding domain-containing protein [Treponema sp.]|nr:transporter substrate-binding domain-containing protein [Treponema sp.]